MSQATTRLQAPQSAVPSGTTRRMSRRSKRKLQLGSRRHRRLSRTRDFHGGTWVVVGNPLYSGLIEVGF
jgi:hypothetical protein